MSLDPYTSHHTQKLTGKNGSTNLSVWTKTIKFLEKKHKHRFSSPWIQQQTLDMTPKPQVKTEKNKLDKILHFLLQKTPIKGTLFMEWETLFSNPEYIKNSYNSTVKRTINHSFKWGRDLNRHFSKDIQMGDKLVKRQYHYPSRECKSNPTFETPLHKF